MGAALGPKDARRRTLAIAASAAGHAVLFAILAWRLGTTLPQTAQPPVMNVQLARLARLAKPPPQPPEDHPVAREASRPASTPAMSPRPATADDPKPQVVAPAPPGDGDERVRQALRRTLGCRNADLLDLSPAERERCRDQLAAGRAMAGSQKLDLDRRGYGASKDVEPYLQRRPKNGCKARAGGEASPSGEQGAAAGVGCAWAF